MKKRFSLATLLALMLPVAALFAIFGFLTARGLMEQELDFTAQSRREYAKVIDARNVLQRGFIGLVDDNALLDGAIRGMVSSLGDKYSHYLNPEEYEAYKARDDNRFVGIGVTVCQSAEGDILISEVYEESPALENGIQPMDRIVAVEGRAISETGYDLAINALAGEENTKVTVTLLRASDNSLEEMTLVRRKMAIKAIYSEILAGQNIGLVRIRNFDQNVDRDFREAMVRLQNAQVDAVIFDVRNNPGGQLDVMCPMLDMLLPKGSLLITLRDKNGNETPRLADSADEIDMPMVVLINENSYSAAEFFAATLYEYEKAILVGIPTTGKGYAQTTIPLEDKSAVILSTLEYFTPKGESLSGNGLKPDYVVRLSEEAQQNFHTLSHEQDNQLQKAIALLEPLLPEGEIGTISEE